ncbi:carbohydrate esterase family 1 protein [Glonium stellatum]|uniref:Carboxylic ester hydrolase n=1 Tax=Glonium stellatum TaxID=574774 RepID=A0A8E2F2E7_9PEZI|nr:carbohydrate esterase family 1 protein [Glonium stellatum]
MLPSLDLAHALTALLLYLPIAASAASLQPVTGFGTNPTNVGMYIYVPDKLASRPPILVVPHACHGKAQDAYTGNQYATLANTYGFIVIYPDSPNTADKCWDVSSPESLSHDGGGDAQGIVSMVKYALSKYNGDANRVFVTGTSSGAMMTNVLCGSYPDVFAAGAGFAGVAFGCFAGNGYDVWSDACAKGNIVKTGAEWAALVTAAYPGYSGFRPKMQVFHGTADTTLYPQNLQEEIKQWTTVLGLSVTASSMTNNTPVAGWTRYKYGSTFEAYSAQGVPHNIPTQESTVMAWFDLTCTSGSCYSRPSNGSSESAGGPMQSGATTLSTIVTTAMGSLTAAGSRNTADATLYG